MIIELLQNVTSAESSHRTKPSSGLICCVLLAFEKDRVIVLSELQACWSAVSGVDAGGLDYTGLCVWITGQIRLRLFHSELVKCFLPVLIIRSTASVIQLYRQNLLHLWMWSAHSARLKYLPHLWLLRGVCLCVCVCNILFHLDLL